MKRLLFAALAAVALGAQAKPAKVATAGGEQTAPTAYPTSGDTVVIGDIEYVILSKADYERLKVGMDALSQKVEKLWTLNSNETGRVALHGSRKATVVTNGEVRVTYADGYTVTQSAVLNRIVKPSVPTVGGGATRKATVPDTTDPFILARREMKRRRAESQKRTNIVTRVIHAGRSAR